VYLNEQDYDDYYEELMGAQEMEEERLNHEVEGEEEDDF